MYHTFLNSNQDPYINSFNWNTFIFLYLSVGVFLLANISKALSGNKLLCTLYTICPILQSTKCEILVSVVLWKKKLVGVL